MEPFVDRRGSGLARILFAWELGDNFGHLVRDVALAKELKNRGHETIFLVRDVRLAQTILAPLGLHFMQAPFCSGSYVRHPEIVSYSEILLASGYSDQNYLAGLINAWIQVYRLIRPSVAVINHAPTALLAAECIGLPSVTLTNGFEVPPQGFPVPPLPPFDHVDRYRLKSADELVLRNVRPIRPRQRSDTIYDLFVSSKKVGVTFPELDHYQRRTDIRYVGPIDRAEGEGLQQVAWQSDARKIVVYFQQKMPKWENLRRALLARPDDELLVVLPGVSESISDHPNLRIFDGLINLEAAFESADLFICYGGVGGVTSALLKGVPVLCIPFASEHAMTAKNVAKMGAGKSLAFDFATGDLEHSIDQLLDDVSFHAAATEFARKYRSFDKGAAIAACCDLISSFG